ncbi:hypothetical protein NC77_17915 [Janthinobacterium lividum]|uniref:hypothetical protein n=1 Tax=Janthinobacterium lividum TaxID=29581 RepID=UPI000536C96C|nr:hypothetical protein [Janthinobacterium lividum]KHA77509.1 hypothetical protein NC77_17915 [Janthinobacterium lividum]
MSALTIGSLENASVDLQHVERVATSPDLEATDRMGRRKKTLAGAIYTIQSIVSRGAWLAGSSYVMKDVVKVGSTWYICVTDHLASNAFSQDSIFWRVYQGVVAGDLAASDGAKYIGNEGNTIDRQIDLYDFNAESVHDFILSGLYPSNFFLLGDSKTAGVGVSALTQQSSWLLSRSLINHQARGFGAASGFGYASRLDMENAVKEPGITSQGTLVNAGFVSSRLSLGVGQSIGITKREIAFVGLIVDADASAGASLQVSMNGVPVGPALLVSGSGIRYVRTQLLKTCSIDDVLTLTASGSSIQVCGIIAQRYSEKGCNVMVAGKSGTAYQDFNSGSALAEIVAHCNIYGGGRPTLFAIALGTNLLYSSLKALSPNDAVLELGRLVDGIRAGVQLVKFLIEIPERADESAWPIIIAGYTYTDYVNAIVDFCEIRGFAMVRGDRSLNSTGRYYADKVHPNADGSRIRARSFCQALGVKYDPYFKGAASDDLAYQAIFPRGINYFVAKPAFTAPWNNFSNSVPLGPSCQYYLNTLVFSGLIAPFGATGRTICKFDIPALAADRYFAASSNGGMTRLILTKDGFLKLADGEVIPSTYISLDNVSLLVFGG